MNNHNIDYNTHKNDNGELFDIRRTIYVVLRYWYLILFIGLTGFGTAYIYNLYREKPYIVESKIIVPKSINEMDFQGVFNLQSGISGSSSVSNEVEILKSYKINQRVAEKLNWRVFWYKAGDFVWEGMFDKTPFIVIENGTNQNTEDVEVYVTIIDQSTVNIRIDGNTFFKNRKIPSEISKNIQYGVQFKNEYFNFTLLLKPGELPEPASKYYFVFRSAGEVASNYRNSLNVKQITEQNEVVQLTLTTLDQQRGIDYLNMLVNEYMDFKLEQKTESHKKSIEFINQQLTGITDSLVISEINFTNFKSKNQLINLSTQGNIVLQMLNDIELEKNNYQMQLEYLNNLLQYIEVESDISKIFSPSVVGISDNSFVTLVQKLIDLFRNREIMAYTARENNPQLIMLNQEIIQVRKLLHENLINLIANTNNNLFMINKRLSQTKTELNRLPEKEQKLVNIQREYQMTNEIYTFLLQKKAETEISLVSTTIDVNFVDKASYYSSKLLGKTDFSIYILGMIIGIMIPVFIIIIFDITDNKVKSKIDIQKKSTIPILGSIVHGQKNDYMYVSNEPASLIAESFRTIRTNIKYFLHNPDEKIIGINSATSGEGKTFTAINLSTVLAMNEKRILLIGCDLRKPKLSRVFNLPSNVGLSTFLININTLSEVIFNTEVENLYVLPAGPVPPNPLEMLEKKEFSELITWAKTNFDYVILDNAPSYLISDGIIAAKNCDMNIFVVRAGKTINGMIENINVVAASSELEKPCFVINDLSMANYGYSYKLNYKYDYKTNYSYGRNFNKGKKRNADAQNN